MKTKTRKILQSRANKLRQRLRRKGFLSPEATAQLATLERRLASDQQREIESTAFEYAISKEPMPKELGF